MIRIPETSLADLAARFGGETRANPRENKAIGRIVPIAHAAAGDLAPLTHARYFQDGRQALARGAALLVDARFKKDRNLGQDLDLGNDGAGDRIWISSNASLALAMILATAIDEATAPVVHPTAKIGEHVVLHPRVVIGKNVVIGANSVIGHPGFGWAIADSGARAIPQLGGVVIEDDVSVGPLSTIDAGTLAPTRIGARTKIDAHVHVGHNVMIGQDCLIAAQCGFAGSAVIGDRVMIGGQAGVGDHVRIGDDAKIAGKSGVIGDVPRGAVVAGYPAMPRVKWLRSIARATKDRESES